MAGILEAVTRALGGVLNDLGGFRFTRTTAAAVIGDVLLEVETTYEWPTPGVFVVNGQVHLYTGQTPTRLTGITHFEGTTETTGLKSAVATSSDVIDFSRTFNDLDKLRSGLFVDTAEGDDLSVLGRDLGVDRPPTLPDDDTFRAVIKALAYTPKGTMYALEVALTAFFGAGNFQLWENLLSTNNTVFISVTGGVLVTDDISQGKTYLGLDISLPLDDTASELTLPETTLQGIFAGAVLEDELHEGDLTAQLPSAITKVRYPGDGGLAVWTFDNYGTAAAESTEVDVVTADSGAVQFDFTGAAALRARYVHHARIQPESEAYLDVHCRFPTLTGTAELWHLRISDGAREIRMGFFDAGSGDVDVGATDSAGVLLVATGSPVTFAGDEYATWAIHKTRYGHVDLLRNGVVFQTVVDVTDFDADTETQFAFGQPSAVEQPDVYVKAVNFSSHTATDYWNTRGLVASVAGASPTTLDTNSAKMLVGDVGKKLRTSGSQQTNSEGGNNNGFWEVATYVDSDIVTLVGRERTPAFVETAHPGRCTVVNDPDAFAFPDARGQSLEVLGAGLNAGTYLVTHVIDEVAGYPYAAGATGASGRCLVVGAATATSGTNGATASGSPDRFIDATASGFVVGDVGRLLLVRSAANGVNAGVFEITAYISADEVEVNSISIGQSFVTEASITWELRETTGFVTESGLDVRLDPNFVNETSTLAWELSDSGSVAALVGTLRDNPPFNFTNIELIMRVRYTMVLSALILNDETVVNAAVPATDPIEFDYYPFYLPASVLGPFAAFIDDLTVAGVIPEVVS